MKKCVQLKWLSVIHLQALPISLHGKIYAYISKPKFSVLYVARLRKIVPRNHSHCLCVCLEVTFEDVIAEPVSVRSGDRVWTWSNALFEVSRVWIYRIVTVLLASPISIISGLLFAILSCFHIW